MAKVKLGEVAKEYKATVKDAADLPVVGLEHLIPGQVELTQWSEDADNTFTKGFKKGQMLFGRRRAYLKKAALAPFDGICSGDITVIEAIPERIMPELLPFVIQNDSLFDYAVEKSAGSLSPRVKWEHLKNYEFELPEKEQQRALVDLLWAMTRTKKAYQELVKKTDELVKSQFIEQFVLDKSHPQEQLRGNIVEMFIGPFGSALKNDCFVEESNAYCMVYAEIVYRKLQIGKSPIEQDTDSAESSDDKNNEDVADSNTKRGKKRRPHVRRAHFQHYWTGEGRTIPVLRWKSDLFVGANRDDQAVVVYEVKESMKGKRNPNTSKKKRGK